MPRRATLTPTERKANSKLSARKATIIIAILKANPNANKNQINNYIKENIPKNLWNTKSIASYIAQKLNLANHNLKPSGRGELTSKTVGERRKAIINLGSNSNQRNEIKQLIRNKSLSDLFSNPLLTQINNIVTLKNNEIEERTLFRDLQTHSVYDTERLPNIQHVRSTSRSRISPVDVAEFDGLNFKSIDHYLNYMRPTFRKYIRKRMQDLNSPIYVRITVSAEMIKKSIRTVDDVSHVETEKSNYDIYDQTGDLFFPDNIEEPLDSQFRKLIEKVDELKDRRESSLSISRITRSQIYSSIHNLFGAGYIETPPELQNWTCNFKHQDPGNEECFIHACVIADEYPKFRGSQHSKKPSTYRKQIEEITNQIKSKWCSIDFPEDEKISQVITNKKESSNVKFPIHPFDGNTIRKIQTILGKTITIYSYENNKPWLIRDVPLRDKTDNPINICLIRKGSKYHYIAITQLNKFLTNGKAECGEKVCPKCRYMTRDSELFYKHRTGDCALLNEAQIALPTPKKAEIAFTHTKYSHPAPFSIIADLEALILKELGKHAANSIGYKVICHLDDSLNRDTKLIHGENCIENFWREVEKIGEELTFIYKNRNVKIGITEEQEAKWQEATNCYICHKQIPLEEKVRDHCHITGLYRGPACSKCNLHYNTSGFKIPVIFHNGKGYDFHFLLKDYIPHPCLSLPTPTKKNNKELTEDEKKLIKQQNAEKIEVIAENSEKFKTIKYKNLSFMDSYQFISHSISDLTNTLLKSNHDWSMLKKEFPNLPLNLLTQKGVYCYDWMDSFEKFNATELPSYEDFKSSIRVNNIPKIDYLRAQVMWKILGCKTFKDYHDFYLKLDIVLLAEIWSWYTKSFRAAHEIDPNHFISGPSACNQAMLKSIPEDIGSINAFHRAHYVDKENKMIPEKFVSNYNPKEVKQIEGQDSMYYTYEKGIRGGFSSALGKRYAVANNKHIPETYDPSKPSKYILYIDANSLYWKSMIQHLPIGDYEYVTKIKNRKLENVLHELLYKFLSEIDEKGNTGYTLTVDITLPRELHETFNDYPLFVERLSPPNSKYEKLIGTLSDKRSYVTDYRMLKLGMELGYRVTKIHEVIKYKQAPFMQPYIQRNIARRKAAKANKDKAADKIAKIDGHNVFGRTMENVRGRINYQLFTYNPEKEGKEKEKMDKKLGKLLMHPRYKGFSKISDNLIGIEISKKLVSLNKPISVGFTILELAKRHMYNFYYNVVKKKYDDKVKAMYTDTDSLFLEIETDDVYADIQGEDLCKYINDSEETGAFSDETETIPIKEVVILQSKMYSYLLANEEEMMSKQLKKEIESDVKTDELLSKMDTDFEYVVSELMSGKYDINEYKVTRRGKGIQSEEVKYKITHEDYKKILLTDELKHHSVDVRRFQSKDHQVSTYTSTKIGLSRRDDKRAYLPTDPINSFAYGYNPL